jgi:hypothetical protein
MRWVAETFDETLWTEPTRESVACPPRRRSESCVVSERSDLRSVDNEPESRAIELREAHDTGCVQEVSAARGVTREVVTTLWVLVSA